METLPRPALVRAGCRAAHDSQSNDPAAVCDGVEIAWLERPARTLLHLLSRRRTSGSFCGAHGAPSLGKDHAANWRPAIARSDSRESELGNRSARVKGVNKFHELRWRCKSTAKGHIE